MLRKRKNFLTEKQLLQRHVRRIKGITTFAVLGALLLSVIPHEYAYATFAANAAANLWWIWAD